ncbi:MAG: hypothetical protein UR52_C0027G0004 [Candidatus Gottesmanbacteria bacterium GW2011_GWA1_34_13]|uniref:Dockerin domain-containing protein n=1 Tax=Candidatus Gottesmanbacteria bacterium GW2011_GWA1_34_13 TaxID=1618434 RepID=A0A0G0DRF5_9BACT|nr:MAG: hypothetical protein UR52_C0027G0004 [Candidatus Gottesmanbacteria bacterium GW2011_GWA1_34_13]
MVNKLLLIISLLLAAVFMSTEVTKAQSENVISINPGQVYQTINGWEATDYIAQPDDPADPYLVNPIADKAVNEIGINRIRLEISPGTENTTDYFVQVLSGQITMVDWVHNYAKSPVNDNSDPNSINLNGFKFTNLDWKIDRMVLPLKQRLEAKGEKLFINLNFVHFGTSNTAFYQYNNASEYAEFMLTTYQHMQTKYGFVPDAIEIELEPSNTDNFSGAEMADAIVATSARLQANGFAKPYFIVPSDPGMSTSINYYNQIIQNTSAKALINEFSYHRYWSPNLTDLQTIVSLALRDGKNTAMLEWWDNQNTYNTLHEDLKIGRNSAWQQETLRGIVNINSTNPTNPVVTIADKSKFTRQYYLYVRSGAQRISATTPSCSDSQLCTSVDPLAFINSNGKYVVVVKASAGGSFTVQNLPAGTYGVYYTTPVEYSNTLQDQTISAGQLLSAAIPRDGVITIYAKTAAGATPTPIPTSTPNPADINGSGRVDFNDLKLILSNWLGLSTCSTFVCDLNNDSKINALDASLVIVNWGQ